MVTRGDMPAFVDGGYIYSNGDQFNEGDIIEGCQSLDEMSLEQLEAIVNREQ